MLIGTAGYEVHWLRNATEVKNQARQLKPDVIIMDVMMPKKSGLEAVRELKADSELCNIPILFVSVLDLPAQHPQELSLSGAAFLQKPFETQDLLKEIRRLAVKST